MLRRLQRATHRAEVNCVPRSLVMVSGTPKRQIHPINKAWAQSAAVMAATGMASGHLEVRSMTVKMYVIPREGGRGPTRSTWMWAKRRTGTGMGAARTLVWR